MRAKTKLFFLFLFISSSNIKLESRSIHREIEPDLPSFSVYQSNKPKQVYSLTDSHIRQFPLFEAYNPEYLLKKQLPSGQIPYRNNPNKRTYGRLLSDKIEHLYKEVLAGKREFKYFTVLKKKDFNFKTKCGLIVLKSNDSPFVVKLFIENPRSITKPYSKGLFPMGMFVMGGTNRHLNGFTRIKNSEDIREKFASHKYWSKRITTPHKWFWIPKKPTWLHITGYKIGIKKVQKSKIPAAFAIIAEEIIADKDQSAKNVPTCLAACTFLDFTADPHYNNFRVEKGTNKLILFDTEHFPTFIGKYSNKMRPTEKYIAWYVRLTRKFVKEKAFSSKNSRRMRQRPGSAYPLY